LERGLSDADRRPPLDERLEALEERIAGAKTRLQGIALERSSTGEARASDHLARLERQGASQIARLEADRDELARESARTPTPAAALAENRYELRLVDERLLDLRRKQVAAERLSPTPPILAALGPRPPDPMRAIEWDDAVDLIHGFRLRYGITSLDGHPLGSKSGDAARRRAREAAIQRLAEVQRQLQRERAQTREPTVEVAR
jgi:hypothetical protein